MGRGVVKSHIRLRPAGPLVEISRGSSLRRRPRRSLRGHVRLGERVYLLTEINSKLAWYVSRSTGVVAFLALTGSVLLGLWVSGRFTKKLPPAAWTTDLHRYLGGMSLILVVIHMIALNFDNYADFGWSELFEPMASEWKPIPVTLGIVAFYLLVAVELTSLIKRFLSRKFWLYIHWLSAGVFALSLLHLLFAGTDVGKPWVRQLVVAVLCIVILFLTARIYVPKIRKRFKKPNPRIPRPQRPVA